MLRLHCICILLVWALLNPFPCYKASGSKFSFSFTFIHIACFNEIIKQYHTSKSVVVQPRQTNIQTSSSCDCDIAFIKSFLVFFLVMVTQLRNMFVNPVFESLII